MDFFPSLNFDTSVAANRGFSEKSITEWQVVRILMMRQFVSSGSTLFAKPYFWSGIEKVKSSLIRVYTVCLGTTVKYNMITQCLILFAKYMKKSLYSGTPWDNLVMIYPLELVFNQLNCSFTTECFAIWQTHDHLFTDPTTQKGHIHSSG